MRISGAVTLAIAATLAACGTKQPATALPAVSTICVVAAFDSKAEETIFLRSFDAYAEGMRYRRAAEDCDATTTFERLGKPTHNQVANWRGLWVSRGDHWQVEGALTVVLRDGQRLVDAEHLHVTGHASQRELLEDLGWRLAQPFSWATRPKTEAR